MSDCLSEGTKISMDEKFAEMRSLTTVLAKLLESADDGDYTAIRPDLINTIYLVNNLIDQLQKMHDQA